MRADEGANATFAHSEHDIELGGKAVSSERATDRCIARVNQTNEQRVADVACQCADELLTVALNPGLCEIVLQVDAVIQFIREEQ